MRYQEACTFPVALNMLLQVTSKVIVIAVPSISSHKFPMGDLLADVSVARYLPTVHRLIVDYVPDLSSTFIGMFQSHLDLP